MKSRLLLYSMLIVFCVFLFYLGYEPYQKDTVELAKRLVSQSQQRDIYDQIASYQKQFGKVPLSLEELTQRGLLDQEDIIPPSIFEESAHGFQYFPEHYRDPNSILISDTRIIPHGVKTKLKSIVIETCGDGKVRQTD